MNAVAKMYEVIAVFAKQTGCPVNYELDASQTKLTVTIGKLMTYKLRWDAEDNVWVMGNSQCNIQDHDISKLFSVKL